MKDNLNKMRSRLAANAVDIVGEAVAQAAKDSPRINGAWNLLKAILATPEGNVAALAYFASRTAPSVNEEGGLLHRV